MMTRRALITVLATTLALAVGACSSSPSGEEAAGQASSVRCKDAIAWKDAGGHVGERANVRGPVVSTHYAPTSNGEPTFLNIGRDYPDEGRFSVVIWGEDRGNFSDAPEDLYDSANVCVTGTIETYQGVPEIVLRSEDDILIEN